MASGERLHGWSRVFPSSSNTEGAIGPHVERRSPIGKSLTAAAPEIARRAALQHGHWSYTLSDITITRMPTRPQNLASSNAIRMSPGIPEGLRMCLRASSLERCRQDPRPSGP